ncbi:RNA polymerase sigma factor [Chryseolinea sp. T2]|uniref:RNA polymerase sigma factor n=1 Tax=Chryseolinea sp. T2 TaxID=3129255 RepID=UPI003FCD788D
MSAEHHNAGIDASILAQLQSSDQKQFEAGWQTLYNNLYPMVERFVLSNSGCRESARDTFHDGMIVLINSISGARFKGTSSVSTYMFAICRNLWIKSLEKRRNIATATNLSSVGDDDDEIFLSRVRAVESLLETLSPDCQRIIREFYYNNQSLEQLRAMFNVKSVEVMKIKKFRCMACLQRVLQVRVITNDERRNYRSDSRVS